jgi:hypothetical protein
MWAAARTIAIDDQQYRCYDRQTALVIALSVDHRSSPYRRSIERPGDERQRRTFILNAIGE